MTIRMTGNATVRTGFQPVQDADRLKTGPHESRSLSNAALRASSRRGAAAVEFALAFPIFMFLFFFLVEASRAMMVVSQLNNAARVACRQAILPTATVDSVETVANEVLTSQGVGGHSTTVLINNQAATLTSALKNDLITVRISIPIARVSWIPGVSVLSGNLLGQYTLPREYS